MTLLKATMNITTDEGVDVTFVDYFDDEAELHVAASYLWSRAKLADRRFRTQENAAQEGDTDRE